MAAVALLAPMLLLASLPDSGGWMAGSPKISIIRTIFSLAVGLIWKPTMAASTSPVGIKIALRFPARNTRVERESEQVKVVIQVDGNDVKIRTDHPHN